MWETYRILDNGGASLVARVHRASKTVTVHRVDDCAPGTNTPGTTTSGTAAPSTPTSGIAVGCTAARCSNTGGSGAEVFRARFRRVWIGQNWSRFRGPWGVSGYCCPKHGEDTVGQSVLLRAAQDDPDTGKPVYFWVLGARIDRFTTDADDTVVQMESVVGSSGVAYPFITTRQAAVLLPFADRHHPDSLVRVPHSVLFQFMCREMAEDDGHACMLSPADVFFEIKPSDLDGVTTHHPVVTVYAADGGSHAEPAAEVGNGCSQRPLVPKDPAGQ